MNLEDVEKELTRRVKEAFVPGTTNTEQVRQLAMRVVNDMACEKEYAPFFAKLYQPNTYSVSCSVTSPEDIGKIALDIERRDPLLIEAYLKNKETK